MSTVYRPASSRALAAGIFAVCVIGLIAFAVQDGPGAVLHYGWWLILVGVLAWAFFWNPRIVVDDSGVLLVNVFRSVRIPWPAIQAIDTKWSLTLQTSYGTFGAWAAPAPGRHGSRHLTEQDVRHLPESSFGVGHSVRPGDAVNSPSGRAAMEIRVRWAALRGAGHLDNPRLEFERPPIRWHVEIFAVCAGLIALGAAGWAL